MINDALRILLADGKPGSEQLDRFFANNRFPLADKSGATFVYRGDVTKVRLQHWIYGLPSSQPLTRVAGTDLWHLHVELPPGSRIEYKLEVIEGEATHLILDPLNQLMAEDPFGANSVCQGYGYVRPDWTLPDPQAPSGSMESLEVRSRALGSRRHVSVYLPARYKPTRRHTLLIVHDGEDFRRYGSLPAVLDNLIHRLEVAPTIAAMIHPGQRLREYAADPRHASFLVDELVPELAARYPLIDEPGSRALLGASFGAVASLHAAWLNPGFFSTLILLSGSFAFTDIGPQRRGAVFEPVVEFVNAFRDNPGRPAERAYVACGIYESLIYENRSFAPFLQEQGVQVRYREARDGHNWENWRDRMQDALSWVFPGPLWMVYE